jgi:hypothetical protein
MCRAWHTLRSHRRFAVGQHASYVVLGTGRESGQIRHLLSLLLEFVE